MSNTPYLGEVYTPSLERTRENYGWTGHDSYVEVNRKIKELEFDRVIDKVRAEALEDFAETLGFRFSGHIIKHGKDPKIDIRELISEIRTRAKGYRG